MTVWSDAMAARAALAKKVDAGTARFAPAFTCVATTYGGPHDPGTGYGGYKRDDLRKWVHPDPFAVAELSTNFTAPLSQLDYRALIMQVPLEQGRRAILDARVTGDPKQGLPHRWPFRLTFGPHSITCAKLDIGRGGPGANSIPRCADLFWLLAAWLNLDNVDTAGWSGLVRIEVALP